MPSAATDIQPSNQNPSQSPAGVAAAEVPGNDGNKRDDTHSQCVDVHGSVTAYLVINSALVELLQPEELRAALVAALAPAILPSSGQEAPCHHCITYCESPLTQQHRNFMSNLKGKCSEDALFCKLLIYCDCDGTAPLMRAHVLGNLGSQ